MGDKLRDEDDALFDDEEGTATASRFYEAEFPEVEDLVMVQVTRVLETNAYVKLLEYGNKEGMILLAEVSAKRIRSMLKEIRVGQFCVCLVLRTEEGRGMFGLRFSFHFLRNNSLNFFAGVSAASASLFTSLQPLIKT